jgi:hypothetical protein
MTIGTCRKGSGTAVGRGAATSGSEEGENGASAADLLMMPPPSRPPGAPESSARPFGTKEVRRVDSCKCKLALWRIYVGV